MFKLQFDRRDFLQTISKVTGASFLGGRAMLPFAPLLEAQDKSHTGSALNEQAQPADAPHPSAVERQPWYRRSLVGMEVGPTGAQFGDSDASDTRYCAILHNGTEYRLLRPGPTPQHQLARQPFSTPQQYLL
jgi:hypothetical protein